MLPAIASAFAAAALLVQGPMPGLVPGPVPGVVRGEVRSEATGQPLPLAIIEVIGAAEPLAAESDSGGRYLLAGVPPGVHLFRAYHIDHAPLDVEVTVPAGSEVYLEFMLEVRPYALAPVAVRASLARPGGDTVAAAAPELGAATVRALEATPGVAELGIADAARGVPGHDPIDPRDVLYVRGATADLKLVLLDGAPVYAPFHLGGLINPFEPELLHRASLYLGGAPARYDGGISYVLDMESRAGRRSGTYTSGAVDMLSAKGVVEGPLPLAGARYLVAGRGVHGLGTIRFVEDPFPYGYVDGLARVDVDAGRDGALAVTAFANREEVQLDSVRGIREPAAWGNMAGSVRYRGTVSGTGMELVAAYGLFDARLPLGGNEPLLAEGTARRARLTADFERPVAFGVVRFGASHDRHWFFYSGRAGGAEAGDPVRTFDTHADGSVTGLYVDATWGAADRIHVRGGLRSDVFSLSPALRIAPRLAATWMITDYAALTLAAGRYRQYIRAPNSIAPPVSPASPDYVPPGPPLVVARASHLVLALDQDLGDGVRFGLEGFFKRFEGVPGTERTAPYAGDLVDPTGQAQASGVDLWVRRSTGRLTGWFGYSLAWIWSVEGDRRATQLFAGRQIVSAGLTGPLGPRGRFDLRFGYGAGLPYTAVPDPGAGETTFAADERAHIVAFRRNTGDVEPLVTSPDEPYMRIDAEVSRSFRASLLGTSFDVTPYLKVLNALDRRDALFYHFDALADAEPRALAALPVLPVLGMEWKF